jgi:hypothetical protein
VSVYNTTIYFLSIKWYIDRATCFDLHWVKESRSKIKYMFYRNALWDFCKTYRQSWICFLWGPEDDPVKVETCRPVYIPFNVHEINCCVIDWHICVFYICQNTSGWQTLKKKNIRNLQITSTLAFIRVLWRQV